MLNICVNKYVEDEAIVDLWWTEKGITNV